VLLCLTFALLFSLIRRHCNPVVGILFTVAAVASSSIHWLARPHLFTMFFLVLFFYILELVREGRSRIAGVPITFCCP